MSKFEDLAAPILPDQFLYNRKGPWPQPSPGHPRLCAPEVLNIPPIEKLLFNETIGMRYLKTQIGFPPFAAQYVVANTAWTGVGDERFNAMMFDTLYTRYLNPLNATELKKFKSQVQKDKPKFSLDPKKKYGMYNFWAMNLVEPLQYMYCAGTRMIYEEDTSGSTTKRVCVAIVVAQDGGRKPDLYIYPEDSSWGLAKIFVMQGAAYHVLFVVHPALHFPFDSVNAITKTSLPQGHPLFKLLYPHTSYSLALDNAVLESANSVVNNNAQGTRFDPLTGNAYNLQLLFGAGFTGLSEADFGSGYPPFDYMKPQMGFDSLYGQWLEDYYKIAFVPFCTAVASYLVQEKHMDYVLLWAKYNHTYVPGFPHASELDPSKNDAKKVITKLAKTLAIYLWDTSVAHGGDHDDFGWNISSVEKCLRIRRPSPTSRNEAEIKVGDIFTGDDLARADIANEMFFKPTAIPPNLSQTMYAFLDAGLTEAEMEFHKNLGEVAIKWEYVPNETSYFMRLTPDPLIAPSPNPLLGDIAYARTLPQSIQY